MSPWRMETRLRGDSSFADEASGGVFGYWPTRIRSHA